MENNIVDIKEVLERLQDDRELLLELLNDFEADYVKKRGALKEAILNKDFELIKDLAHSLKGSSGNVSVKAMHNCFMLIELHLTLIKDVNLINDVLNDVDRQFSELKDFKAALEKELAGG